MPAIVRVAPMCYMVRVVDGLVDGAGNRLLGEASAGDLEIRVDADQPASGFWPTLVHEILHLVLEQAGHMEAAADENLIRALTYGLMNVSIDGMALLRGGRDGSGQTTSGDRQGSVSGSAAGDGSGDGQLVREAGQGDRAVGHRRGEL